MRYRFPLAVVALLVPALLTPASLVAQQTIPVVTVNCAEGESINRALTRRPTSPSLIVEISGMCAENVVVTRDRVTLRGGDPTQDGVQATGNANDLDAAVWVRGAHLVAIENLRLTGGYIGLLATEASTQYLRALNLAIDGNARYGILLQESQMRADDLVVSNNAVNAGVFQASRLECGNCQLLDPLSGQAANIRTNLLASNASSVVMLNATLTGGGVNAAGASVSLLDSSVTAFPGGAAIANGDGQVALTRVTLEGPLNLSNGGSTRLFGVTQVAVAAPGLNGLDAASFLSVSDSGAIGSSLINLRVANFSSATIGGLSKINGNLVCQQGGNMYCPNASVNVTGTTTGCALCQKP
jgi:hypothetical protein